MPDRDALVLVALPPEPAPGVAVRTWRATDPQGPWADAGSPGDVGPVPARGTAYQALVHPEFGTTAEGALLSFNVNGLTPEDNRADAFLYRPRFVRLPITP